MDTGNNTNQQGGNLSEKGWTSNHAIINKPFPYPDDYYDELRILFEKEAFSDFIVDSRSSLDKEICGVLVGEVFRDNKGIFLEVQAIIHGDSAKEEKTSVTFTQETWNKIHLTMEKKYPKKQIVGWYHTHPGFGVDFSEMDLFIQNNFFSLPTQIALLTDPLSGEVAICINTEEGTDLVHHFWVDRHEMKTYGKSRIRQTVSEAVKAPIVALETHQSEKERNAYEKRINNALKRMEAQQQAFQSNISTLGLIIALGVFGLLSYFIFDYYQRRTSVAELKSKIEVPVEIDGVHYQLGVNIYSLKRLSPKKKEEEKSSD